MSILNRNQRAVICLDTMIDPILLDRCCDAFDALIEHGDVEAYRRYMTLAWAQMGFGPNNPIKASDRPTALDKSKTLCARAYADRAGMDFKPAVNKLRRMLEG